MISRKIKKKGKSYEIIFYYFLYFINNVTLVFYFVSKKCHSTFSM